MDQPRSVEIRVISAEQLKLGNRFLKRNTFVIVRMNSCNYGRTSLDSQGGSFPTWDETFRLPMPSSARSFPVEVHCKTAFGAKMIGKADVPVSDFAGNLTTDWCLRFLSYRLSDMEGRKKGIVNLSVRMDVPDSVFQPSVYRIPRSPTRWDFPIGEENSAHWVAVGIPVSYAVGIPLSQWLSVRF